MIASDVDSVNHDGDDENYVETLETAWNEYRKACYGDRELSVVQLLETRQAFLSGIYWLNTRDSYNPEDLDAALRVALNVPRKDGA